MAEGRETPRPNDRTIIEGDVNSDGIADADACLCRARTVSAHLQEHREPSV
jgi:hypothetical protein